MKDVLGSETGKLRREKRAILKEEIETLLEIIVADASRNEIEKAVGEYRKCCSLICDLIRVNKEFRVDEHKRPIVELGYYDGLMHKMGYAQQYIFNHFKKTNIRESMDISRIEIFQGEFYSSVISKFADLRNFNVALSIIAEGTSADKSERLIRMFNRMLTYEEKNKERGSIDDENVLLQLFKLTLAERKYELFNKVLEKYTRGGMFYFRDDLAKDEHASKIKSKLFSTDDTIPYLVSYLRTLYKFGASSENSISLQFSHIPGLWLFHRIELLTEPHLETVNREIKRYYLLSRLKLRADIENSKIQNLIEELLLDDDLEVCQANIDLVRTLLSDKYYKSDISKRIVLRLIQAVDRSFFDILCKSDWFKKYLKDINVEGNKDNLFQAVIVNALKSKDISIEDYTASKKRKKNRFFTTKNKNSLDSTADQDLYTSKKGVEKGEVASFSLLQKISAAVISIIRQLILRIVPLLTKKIAIKDIDKTDSLPSNHGKDWTKNSSHCSSHKNHDGCNDRSSEKEGEIDRCVENISLDLSTRCTRPDNEHSSVCIPNGQNNLQSKKNTVNKI